MHVIRYAYDPAPDKLDCHHPGKRGRETDEEGAFPVYGGVLDSKGTCPKNRKAEGGGTRGRDANEEGAFPVYGVC